MNRKDFQILAALRLKEAKLLLEAGCWEGAYYLGGYAAECALKACIAKQTKRHDFPPDQKRVNRIYTHDLGVLLNAAELGKELAKSTQADAELNASWGIVKEWSESSRYASRTAHEAEQLLDALADRKHGVIPWFKRRW